MGADIISILFFITAIVLAFIRKINIGIVALALAVPCTMLIGLPGKEIIAGVNGNLFITLVGITLLFSIVNDTGALGLLAHKNRRCCRTAAMAHPDSAVCRRGHYYRCRTGRYPRAGHHDSHGHCRRHTGRL